MLQACCEQTGVAVKYYVFVREISGGNLDPITVQVL